VPNVVGLTESDARKAIEAVVGLSVGDEDRECSDSVQAGLVSSQYPAAGETVLCKTAVGFAVSTGRPEVPNVVGLTESDARKAIEAVVMKIVSAVTVYRQILSAASIRPQENQEKPCHVTLPSTLWYQQVPVT
jgi:beta-lactam-binding protein with PASTA domain